MRTETQYTHGHFCDGCQIDNETNKIMGWYNQHGIVVMKVKDYPRLGNGSLIV